MVWTFYYKKLKIILKCMQDRSKGLWLSNPHNAFILWIHFKNFVFPLFFDSRKELIYLRNSNSPSPSSASTYDSNFGWTNEAKNDKLRLRWLESTVSELQAELAEVLRARNTSEELAERSILRSEIELLRADVAGFGKGLRDLGGKIDRLESTLGIVKIDLAATKERNNRLSRVCKNFTEQVSFF